jgi:hypothetical protein
MSRLSSSTTVQSSTSNLHQSAEQYVPFLHHLLADFDFFLPRFIASSSNGLHIEAHRERFQERTLRDLTIGSNDGAMMLDPNNPTLVGDEMVAQKVGPGSRDSVQCFLRQLADVM